MGHKQYCYRQTTARHSPAIDMQGTHVLCVQSLAVPYIYICHGPTRSTLQALVRRSARDLCSTRYEVRGRYFDGMIYPTRSKMIFLESVVWDISTTSYYDVNLHTIFFPVVFAVVVRKIAFGVVQTCRLSKLLLVPADGPVSNSCCRSFLELLREKRHPCI